MKYKNSFLGLFAVFIMLLSVNVYAEPRECDGIKVNKSECISKTDTKSNGTIKSVINLTVIEVNGVPVKGLAVLQIKYAILSIRNKLSETSLPLSNILSLYRYENSLEITFSNGMGENQILKFTMKEDGASVYGLLDSKVNRYIMNRG